MSETVNDDFELGIGTALRDARVARNLSLAEVSALLRIREAHLEAIELEDFEQLPGNVYAIGFIRTYAQYLELNESDLIMRFKAASIESMLTSSGTALQGAFYKHLATYLTDRVRQLTEMVGDALTARGGEIGEREENVRRGQESAALP